jgi:hypothetical protein
MKSSSKKLVRGERKVKVWWEKDWDKQFGKFLSETSIFIGKGFTFNDLAKQHIDMILRKEIRDMTERHNLIAIAIERNGNKNKQSIKKVETLIKQFEETRNEASKFIKQLNEIIN